MRIAKSLYIVGLSLGTFYFVGMILLGAVRNVAHG